MGTIAETRKPTVSVEELLNLMQNKKEPEPRVANGQGKAKTGFPGFPAATIMLGLLIIALGAMITVLKSDIAILKSDIVDLNTLKTQAVTMDGKREVGALEEKLNEIKKQGEAMRGEIAQFRNEIEALKAERKQGKK